MLIGWIVSSFSSILAGFWACWEYVATNLADGCQDTLSHEICEIILFPRTTSARENVLAVLQLCAPPFLIPHSWDWTAVSLLLIVFNPLPGFCFLQYIRFDVLTCNIIIINSKLNHFTNNYNIKFLSHCTKSTQPSWYKFLQQQPCHWSQQILQKLVISVYPFQVLKKDVKPLWNLT